MQLILSGKLTKDGSDLLFTPIDNPAALEITPTASGNEITLTSSTEIFNNDAPVTWGISKANTMFAVAQVNRTQVIISVFQFDGSPENNLGTAFIEVKI